MGYRLHELVLLALALVQAATTAAFFQQQPPPPSGFITTYSSISRRPNANPVRPRAPPKLAAGGQEDDDLTERSLSLLGKLAEGLNRELPVPTLLVPPRVSEAGKSGGGSTAITTIKGWFPLSMGLSLTLGNPAYPAALVGFLYLSRPTDAPDVAAAAAAALVAGVVNPLLANFAEATGLDESGLGRIPFLLGVAATGWVLLQVLGEGKEVFVDAPRREEKERMPAAKAERDLRFFDVKVKNQTQGEGGKEKAAAENPPPKAGSGGGSGGGDGGATRWRE